MKKMALLFVWLMMASILSASLAAASSDDGKLYWGEVKSGTYRPLHPHTLNWTGDVLDKGGLSLATMNITTDRGKADIVMNQYGSIGASSLRKLTGEKLDDPTPKNQENFGSSYTMAKGDLYLVALSDGSYAKLRIDRLLPEGGLSYQQVAFSYVLEDPAKAPVPPQPEPQKPGKATTPEASNRPSTIQLTVGKQTAVVQGKSVSLQVPPTVVGGTTLVPLRFMAESLGSELTWDAAERKITLKKQGLAIELWIDRSAATVNGKTVPLEAAPSIIQETTMVPIRFISETFEQKVGYDARTQTITVTGKAGGAASTTASVEGQGFVAAMMGNYELTYTGAEAEEAIGSFSIYQDGTYLVKLKHQGEFAGVWGIAKEREVEKQPEAIILKFAMEKSDWAVVRGQDGTIQLLQKYVYSNNALYNTVITTTWMPVFTGIKASDDPAAIDDYPMKDYDFSSFVGSYELWIEGGATNLYYKDTGNYATHEYQAGAAAGTLTIHEDGTYTMKTKNTVEGSWRESKVNEVFGYEHSIILEDGPDGIDWTLLVNASGKKMVSYEAGHWADGSVMWLPYYIAGSSAE